ncbi:MAG: helix-turn-helix transcriptional regulator [Sulfuricurvum sp.]|uniref:helix-turn-helix transcriptional regulator n=1 Tax=Sulfuricurvum sp. TaxID=2025608 RepID=UPI002732A601|nr:helix-turn-helix transcriptional regulator [Sulfuricurvum sp.]MDP2849492.1 helix-turn-helix transcriptional regulator [Sulfuricurvum sp.]
MQESIVFSDDEISLMYKRIGENVKKYRELKEMSQLQLSNAMGYNSVSLVSAAELCSDGKHFNLEHLYKIAKILDIAMCKLINT